MKRAEHLCLECGLCCNGTIFADVRLNQADQPELLRREGLRINAGPGGRPRLVQPCAALEGKRCRIYELRPGCCRQFECLLLKSVKAGRTDFDEAQKIISTAL